MNGLRLAWDRLSLYLPVVLMAVLALVTYLLVSNTPILQLLTEKEPPRHEVDYFMRSFAVKVFDPMGQVKSEVTGELAQHYPDTDKIEIDKVRIRSIDPQGRQMIAVADKAMSSADAKQIELFNNVLVVRETTLPQGNGPKETLEFRGAYLYAWLDDKRLVSNKPVVLSRGADQFSADTMEYDDKTRVIQLRGRVKGVLMPDRLN